MPARHLPVLLFLVPMALMPRSAAAAWPHEPYVNVPLSAAAGHQLYSTIVSDGAGGAIVTWHDSRNGSYDVYAQRVNATGVPQWTADGVVLSAAGNDQATPTIASDGAGGAIVTWTDNRSGTSYDIYAQRVSAAGVPQWTANGVALCTAAGDQYRPITVSDGAGGAIVTWYDSRSGNFDIYVRPVNAAGVSQWTADGVSLCTDVNDQHSPLLASDGAGGAIIAWEDSRNGTWDIYAHRVNAAGVRQWITDGIPLCTASGDQSGPGIVSDGAGGAVVVWQDYRSGTDQDIYARRVNAAGVPQWIADGVALCTAAADQYLPTLASDGAGGAIAAWYDFRSGTNSDIYARRVNAAGLPQWTSDGVALCTAPGDQYEPEVVSDGAGGAIVTWHDYRTLVDSDIYARRVNAAGVPQWTADGVAISVVVGDQEYPVIASDGAGGAIVTWQDWRESTNADAYAQRVERFGYLGNPEPSIVSVKDVLNDQGGKVSIRWSASHLDVAPGNPIDAYWIWRQVPGSLAGVRLQAGADRFDSRAGSEPRSGAVRVSVHAGQTYYWEFAGSQVAHGFPAYSYTAPTLSDSVSGSNPFTLFMVEAEQTSTGFYWGSFPDSGYSVDNLSPVTPAPFTGNYSAGATHLHWGTNGETDLAGYRIYRGSSAGFVPGPGNLIATQPDTGYADAGPAGSYYKLSAVDVHGNESGFALLSPSATTDVGPAGPRSLALAPPRPNPARGRFTIGLSLPAEQDVALALYDAHGRRVRVIHSGRLEAGQHAISMEIGGSGDRAIRSGLYFVRLEAGGEKRVQRIAIME